MFDLFEIEIVSSLADTTHNLSLIVSHIYHLSFITVYHVVSVDT